MSAKIAHRGPDGEGIFLTREHEEINESRPQAGLAFRRLAILDPDPRAMQPFTIGHQTIVFNGEIYNFRELRDELTKRRPDYPWRTTGDTEVLLLSYATWGEKCLEKLNGMFAFAVWDEEKKELFLARDRMGQKPLYFAWTAESKAIVFASEISAIRAVVHSRGIPIPSALAEYLAYGYWPGSLFMDIFQIAPSKWQRFRLSEASDSDDPLQTDSEEYFSIDDRCRAVSGPGNARSLIQAAVEKQLVSDVPVGLFLSGGIDSSVIACCARRVGKLKSFSICFDDPRYDESIFARRVAEHLDTEHHEFRVTPRIVEDLPRIMMAFSEPFADSSALPTYYLAQETRKHVKVALSGDGGDELFGGYDRYRAMQLGAWLCWLYPFRPLAKMFSGGHPKSHVARSARFLESLSLNPAKTYDSYMRIFSDSLINELYCIRHLPIALVAIRFQFHLRKLHSPVRAALATDREEYLPNDLLTKVDRASMLHALEVRSPFMDHELVQFAAGLTTDQLLKGGPKRMLREAFAADLPDFVFKRKKMGFAVPIGDWLRNELRPMLHDHLFAANSFARAYFNLDVVRRLIDEHESHRVDHSQRLYALLMLELWHVAFNRGPT